MPKKYTRQKPYTDGGNVNQERPVPIDSVRIMDNSGYATGVVTLMGDESFLIESGRLLFVEQGSSPDDQVNVKSITNGSLMSSFKRKMLSGENIFFNKFSGAKSGNPVRLHFASPYPGDIIKIMIEPGESYTLSAGSFIAGTANLNVSSKLNVRGIFSGEGLGLTLVKNKTEYVGHVYVGCFGKANSVRVKNGEEVLIDNGAYLASKNIDGKKSYELTKLKGLKTFVFGGEGLLMKFTNTDEDEIMIYTQSRNLHDFAMGIHTYLPKSDNTEKATFSIF